MGKKRTNEWLLRVHEAAKQLEIPFDKFHTSVECVLRVGVFDASERQHRFGITIILMNIQIWPVLDKKFSQKKTY